MLLLPRADPDLPAGDADPSVPLHTALLPDVQYHLMPGALLHWKRSRQPVPVGQIPLPEEILHHPQTVPAVSYNNLSPAPSDHGRSRPST